MVPPIVPKDKSMASPTLGSAMEESCEEEFLPEEVDGESQAVAAFQRVKKVMGKSPNHTSSLKGKGSEPISRMLNIRM